MVDLLFGAGRYLAHMAQVRNGYKVVVGQPEGKREVWSCRCI